MDLIGNSLTIKNSKQQLGFQYRSRQEQARVQVNVNGRSLQCPYFLVIEHGNFTSIKSKPSSLNTMHDRSIYSQSRSND